MKLNFYFPFYFLIDFKNEYPKPFYTLPIIIQYISLFNVHIQLVKGGYKNITIN